MPPWLISALGWLDRVRHEFRKRRMNPSRALGFRAEDVAIRHLQRLGYRVVGRNFRPSRGHGEIDIVAYDGPTFVCIEVKALTSDHISGPERAVNKMKVSALGYAGVACAIRFGENPRDVRFDLLTIVFHDPPVIRLEKGSRLLRPRHAVC